MSLFGTEFHLFDGDLLGFPLAEPAENEEVVAVLQDGLKSTTSQPATSLWQVEDIALGPQLTSTSFSASKFYAFVFLPF